MDSEEKCSRSSIDAKPIHEIYEKAYLSNNLDEVLKHTIEKVGEVSNVCRVTLVIECNNRKNKTNILEWTKKKTKQLKEIIQMFPFLILKLGTNYLDQERFN